jgi:hypothetical protein
MLSVLIGDFIHNVRYGDNWFAESVRRSVPVMSSFYDWPLLSPVALVCHIERAARIVLLPEDGRAGLTEGPTKWHPPVVAPEAVRSSRRCSRSDRIGGTRPLARRE